MGNLCSIIDADADNNYGKEPPRYSGGAHLQTATCQQLLNQSTEKRSSHSSSPDRRRPGGREGPSVTVDQQDREPCGDEWRSPPTAAAAAAAEQHAYAPPPEPEPEPEMQPIVPFSWTKGELIGIGAFGRVFSALNNVTGELVAVKQVSFAKDEALQGRVVEHIKALEAEVEVLKTLQHENIVRYLGTEITEDSLHIFLEYVPGGSIASLLAKFGAFPESVIRVYTAQLLRGLEYLHQKGIMHRDIKGANILIDKHGTVKLADFGASKKIEDLATVGSGSKSIRGTPYWMAPEVIKQTGHGRPADIWSLACTVIEMATGKPPWSSYTAPVAAMFQIASSKDPPPLPQHLSREAQDFLLLCFNRVARDRANATRLLKHPFVANVPQVQQAAQQQLPVPSTPANNAASSSSSSPAGTNGTPNRSGGAEQRQQHATPMGARQSNGMMPNSSSSHRPPISGSMSAAQAAAVKAAKQSRYSPNGQSHCSPSSQSRCSPKRQHPGAADSSGVSSAAAASSMCQRGESAAPMRSPMQQQHHHHRQPEQQQQASSMQTKLSSQQQQQQQQNTPQPFDSYRQREQQQQQQLSSVRRSGSPLSAAALDAAAQAEQQLSEQQQQNCMTLVDWNPVQEPSWLPPYQVPAAQQQQAPSSRRQSLGQPNSSEQQVQQQQQQPGIGSRQQARPSLPGAQQQVSMAPPEQPELDAPKAAAAAGPRGSGILSSSNPAAKRASLPATSSSISASSAGAKRGMPGASIGRKPGDMASPRGNSIISSSGAAAGAGPLAQGPAGRASSAMAAGAIAAGGGSILSGVGMGQAKAKPRGVGMQGSVLLQQQQQQTQLLGGGASAVGGSPAGGASPSNAAAAAAGGAPSPSSKADDGAAAAADRAAAGHSSGQDQLRSASVAAGGAADKEEDVSMSSKRAQWESELYEELERHRQEQRATRMSAYAQRM